MSSRVMKDMSVIASYPVLLSHEEQMIKTPYDVTGWCSYLAQIDDLLDTVKQHEGRKKNKTVGGLGGRDDDDVVVGDLPKIRKQLVKVRRHVAQRAVSLLPGSYKLWKSHLSFLVQHDTSPTITTRAFEECLVRLHKMPRLWMDYIQYTMKTNSENITTLRRLLNRALEALPVTQHDKIWPLFIEWLTLSSEKIPSETIVRVLRRYAHSYNPTFKERLADICVELERYGEASLLLLEILNDVNAITTTTSKHDLWMKFAHLCTHHPSECQRVGIDFERLVRSALNPPKSQGWSVVVEDDNHEETTPQQQQPSFERQLGEMEGTLWAKLADYYVRMGEFEMARSVFEEALESVSRVRDFSILFDNYVKLEEGVVEAMMALQDEDEEDEESPQQQQDDKDDWDILLLSNNNNDDDIELALERAEHLTSRRPLLLNRVLLRQNPHNVGEWIKRSSLYEEKQPEMAAAALEEALRTVNSRKAVNGMPSQIVLELVKLYEAVDVEKARDLLDRICNQHAFVFYNVDDLAQCHAAYVELELRHEAWDAALSLARRAVAAPDALEGPVARVAKGLQKSLRLWDVLLDLEESLGTITATKNAYNRAMELKVATPMHILNYASFLTDQKYFEESFTAYERGVELFDFSSVLWKHYLEAFIKRYGGSKMERTRDLFDRCLEACPPEESSDFFMMYGEFEEKHGLTKRALNVYRDMCHKVPAEEKYMAYQLFIAKTIKYMGVPATRDVYQEAIEALPDQAAAQMCLDFSKMETSLQELDRARAILTYGAQMADPRRFPEYWAKWNEFEVSHGNEETFREMLRVKRSVQAAFSTVNYNAMGMDVASENLTNEEAMHRIASQEGVDVPSAAAPVQGFVQATKRKAEVAQLDEVENRVAKLRKATAAATETAAQGEDEEIDIDDLEDDEEEEEEAKDSSKAKAETVRDVSTKAVPAAVFGGLESESRSEENMGALERLRAAAADRTKGDTQQLTKYA